MGQVRITGLVRQANHFRRILSGPITPAQRDALAARLRAALRDVDQLLARHRHSPADLPAPSRRAYQFLRELDLGRVAVSEGAVPAAPIPAESISFRGLRGFLERILDDVAINMHARRLNLEAMHRVIRRTRDRLEHALTRDGIRPEHLRLQTREVLGWFRYFADPDSFALYTAGVCRGQQFFTPSDHKTVWKPPLLVHFRPSRGLYRWQVMRAGTRIVLNTPTLAFSDEALGALGRQMTGGREDRAVITEAMLSDEYQALAAEIELAGGGALEHTRGIAYDLADVFEKVNRLYFAGRIARPRLTWNGSLTGRKFGHYDFIRDVVMISASLDHPDVPVYVVEHVMHHELLHKKHGFRWRGDRRHTHTPEFRREERSFARYGDADLFLRQLSRKAGS